MTGLAAFAVVFAINSAVHSYLVLAYTDEESVALNVGFYYMANAGGRLLGTLLSGLIFQGAGFQGCLWGSAAMVLLAAIFWLNSRVVRRFHSAPLSLEQIHEQASMSSYFRPYRKTDSKPGRLSAHCRRSPKLRHLISLRSGQT